jgi:hypothetical protein
MSELADSIERLARKHREPWYVVNVKMPFEYPDGTTHYTHVHYTAHDRNGAPLTVGIARHVTPELAELLCLLHNNIDVIIEALRKSEKGP